MDLTQVSPIAAEILNIRRSMVQKWVSDLIGFISNNIESYHLQGVDKWEINSNPHWIAIETIVATIG